MSVYNQKTGYGRGEEWQEKEREAEKDIQEERLSERFESTEKGLQWLKK